MQDFRFRLIKKRDGSFKFIREPRWFEEKETVLAEGDSSRGLLLVRCKIQSCSSSLHNKIEAALQEIFTKPEGGVIVLPYEVEVTFVPYS